MPSDDEKRTIEQKIYQLNSLLAEIRQFRIAHPETRVGHYTNSVGSLLNAYREGDIGFAECVVAIKAAAPSPVAAENSTLAEQIISDFIGEVEGTRQGYTLIQGALLELLTRIHLAYANTAKEPHGQPT